MTEQLTVDTLHRWFHGTAGRETISYVVTDPRLSDHELEHARLLHIERDEHSSQLVTSLGDLQLPADGELTARAIRHPQNLPASLLADRFVAAHQAGITLLLNVGMTAAGCHRWQPLLDVTDNTDLDDVADAVVATLGSGHHAYAPNEQLTITEPYSPPDVERILVGETPSQQVVVRHVDGQQATFRVRHWNVDGPWLKLTTQDGVVLVPAAAIRTVDVETSQPADRPT